ncbi:MAG: hypothetical protein CMB43_01005 [Euryarchaeota archaeon]|nr:hypothetical protein [Euryarchaeota archaeon]|tara:strand:+ start:6132 stop:6512 length:381 start_codon:yes stop_codon:yes gene_type:complete
MTQQIIVDSCGWVAIIDSKINFELELERIFGNFTLILTESVSNELTDIDASRSRKKSLLMDLLKQKSAPMRSKLAVHTDDHIFELAQSGNYAVLTIDKVLKKRLYQRGIDVVEVAKNQHLRLIEGL